MDYIYVVQDGANWHKGLENRKLQEDTGYKLIDWPPQRSGNSWIRAR